jgi:hypothetical protein
MVKGRNAPLERLERGADCRGGSWNGFWSAGADCALTAQQPHAKIPHLGGADSYFRQVKKNLSTPPRCEGQGTKTVFELAK